MAIRRKNGGGGGGEETPCDMCLPSGGRKEEGCHLLIGAHSTNKHRAPAQLFYAFSAACVPFLAPYRLLPSLSVSW